MNKPVRFFVSDHGFGTEFETGDQLFIESIEADFLGDETIQLQVKVNKVDAFRLVFNDKFVDTLIGLMEQNQELVVKILEDKALAIF